MVRKFLASLTVALVYSCGEDDHPHDAHSGGNAECQALGSYCHDPGEIDEAAEECHQVMHEAEDGCMERYDECKAICQAVIEATGAGGAEGQGGAATAGAGAPSSAGVGGRD